MPFIKSTVLTIEQVYAGSYRLELPWFQRAYAWDEMHVGRLIKDLLEAMSGPKRRYSLGHMSLATAGPGLSSSIVDGHQRSISLTMLFALMRDLLPLDPMADRLQLLIEAPGGGFRLCPQPGVAAFYSTYVQQRGATVLEPDGEITRRSPSERKILDSRDHMRRMLRKIASTPAELATFAEFVLERCFVIVDEVEDEEEAQALLTREEETGVSPHSSELAKVTILSAMPREEQDQAAQLFERAQSHLSADNMSNLLGHIRSLKVRKRSSKSVDGELIQQFKLHVAGLPFLSQELLPKAEAMAQIIAGNVGRGAAREATARSLETLCWLDHQLWMPAALHWLATMGADHAETPLFFARLDRLAYLLKIASVDPTDQEQRFLSLLGSLDEKRDDDSIKVLAIEQRLLADALESLRSRTFYAKRFHAVVLRRISRNIAPDRDPGPVDGKKVTVEHVLPRKPTPERKWCKDFPSPQIIADYCNRLGNMAFLSLEENNIAGTSDFIVKRYLLAAAAGRFVISEHASKETEWTTETIERRGEALIALLLKPWQLSP